MYTVHVLLIFLIHILWYLSGWDYDVDDIIDEFIFHDSVTWGGACQRGWGIHLSVNDKWMSIILKNIGNTLSSCFQTYNILKMLVFLKYKNKNKTQFLLYYIQIVHKILLNYHQTTPLVVNKIRKGKQALAGIF